MQALRISGHGRARAGAIVLAAGALVACTSAAVASGGAVAATGARAAATGGPVARTDTGLVQGKVAGSTDEFLGIPYAAPPVGALRWAPPAPAASWAGIRPATSFAPHCPQTASPFGQASTSEDCLFLNVYKPARAPANRPVMVWIHGGALVTGESDDYNPAKLVRHGVVVVTINYRLGALGFLADGALAAQLRRPGGQLRADGPAGRAALGSAEHRPVRRQPAERDHLR